MFTSGFSSRFQLLFPVQRQVAHALLTLSPLIHRSKLRLFVRLACLIHAASVRSEPGSNSPKKMYLKTDQTVFILFRKFNLA